MCERCALGSFRTVAVAFESGRACRLVVLDWLQTKFGSRLPEEAICFGSIFLIGEIRQTGIPGDMLLPGVAKRILGFDFGDLTLFADICVVHVDDVLCRLRLSAAEAAPLLLCRLHERSEEHTSELQSLMRISYAV